MKKVLLAGTALLSMVALTTPAQAKNDWALKLDLGGFFFGYGVYADNDELPGALGTGSLNKFDLRREMVVVAGGEATLDNGLTYGVYTEMGQGAFMTTADNTGVPTVSTVGMISKETYGYLSGGWGRFNIGSEDGAAYLLQVNAPSADSIVDGMTIYLQALNRRSTLAGATSPYTSYSTGAADAAASGAVVGLNSGRRLDYDHSADPLGATVTATDRFTYLTPKVGGFQAGVSYAPEPGANIFGGGADSMQLDNAPLGAYGAFWEAGARWDGEFNGVGISLGGGYSDADLQNNAAASTAALGGLAVGGANEAAAAQVSDGLTIWNLGANVSFQGFSLGGVWLRADTTNRDVFDAGNNAGVSDTAAELDVEQDTYTVGLAWDNGPYHLGGSWLRQQTERDGAGDPAVDGGAQPAIDYTAERFTVGGALSFAEGISFRGSVAWGEIETDDRDALFVDGNPTADNDFTQVAVGTIIAF